MASKKTILSFEATSNKCAIEYSGGFRIDWSNLTKSERREALRHDNRIADALLNAPEEVYVRLMSIFRAVDRCKRREAKRNAKQEAEQQQVSE